MRRNEIAPFAGSLFKDFDKEFGSLFPSRINQQFDAPRMDIMERDGHLVASFDVPGVKKDDVKVDVNGDIVSVSGERKDEYKGDLYSEKFYGSFKRSFKVPKDYDINKLEANFEHGVLSVALPLREPQEDEKKEVEIKEHKDGIFKKLFG